MSTAVVGPGAHGVVVAAEGAAALRRRSELEEVGIPAATLAELGVDTPTAPEDPVRFWAQALRRPAVGAGAGEETATGPGGEPADTGDPRVLLELPLPPRVAVFGGSFTPEDDPDHHAAVRLGAELAYAGVQVVSGGYQGVMAAVSRGAAEAGGTVVGVTIAPWARRADPNPWLTHEARARDLFARLPLICDADAWIAFSGGAGTLAEIALCWNLLQADREAPRPLVVVGERWGRALDALREMLVVVRPSDHDLVRRAGAVDDALAIALSSGTG